MAGEASLGGGNNLAKSLIPSWGQGNAGGADSPFGTNGNAGNSNQFMNAGKLQQNQGNGGQFTGAFLGGGAPPAQQEEPSDAINNGYPALPGQGE